MPHTIAAAHVCFRVASFPPTRSPLPIWHLQVRAPPSSHLSPPPSSPLLPPLPLSLATFSTTQIPNIIFLLSMREDGSLLHALTGMVVALQVQRVCFGGKDFGGKDFEFGVDAFATTGTILAFASSWHAGSSSQRRPTHFISCVGISSRIWREILTRCLGLPAALFVGSICASKDRKRKRR